MPCKPRYTYVNLTCHPEQKFTCTENTCQCLSNYLYEDNNERSGCFLKLYEACGETSADPFPCISNATCTNFNAPGPDSPKSCRCDRGFISEWEEEIDAFVCTAGVDAVSPFSFGLIIFTTVLCKLLSFDLD